MVATTTTQIAKQMMAASGISAITAPPATATPLPPLKRSHTGKTWPAMAAAAATAGQGSSVRSRAITTATTPLRMSAAITAMPISRPRVRNTFAAPRFPLPTVRRSTPRARPARNANGIEPSR